MSSCSENELARTTAKSVMPSKPLPSNPSHGFTYRFTHMHNYKQYWTADIAELVIQRNQTGKRIERDPINATRANYNKVEAHINLLTNYCKADTYGEMPKQRVRRQPLKTDDLTDSRKKAKSFNTHFTSTGHTRQYNPRIDVGMNRNMKHKQAVTHPTITEVSHRHTQNRTEGTPRNLKPHNSLG